MSPAAVSIPPALSWSQIATDLDCGEKWKLQKGYRLDPSTWYATLAGSALHHITELEDRRDDLGEEVLEIPSFEVAFDREIQEALDEGKTIKASGRKGVNMTTSGGPNKKDRAWFLHFAPSWLEAWRRFKRESGWTIAIMPDGKPGIEIEFTVSIGGVPVRGFIDRLYIDSLDRLVILDLKSGDTPKSGLQLDTYSKGIKATYGLVAQRGFFWMAGKTRKVDGEEQFGVLSQEYDLEVWDDAYTDYLYGSVKRSIDQGIFLPNPGMMCNGCSVRKFCRAQQGLSSGKFAITPDLDTSRVLSVSEEIPTL